MSAGYPLAAGTGRTWGRGGSPEREPGGGTQRQLRVPHCPSFSPPTHSHGPAALSGPRAVGCGGSDGAPRGVGALACVAAGPTPTSRVSRADVAAFLIAQASPETAQGLKVVGISWK